MTDAPNQRPEKRPRGRPKTVDRGRTVALAMETYWRDGVHALSLNEVCRRAEISKPSLYREFGGEDGLMHAALEAFRERCIVPVTGLLHTESTSAAALDRVVVAMTEAFILTEDRWAPTGCLFTKMRLAGDRVGPETQERVREIARERRAVFEEWFRRGLERGDVDAELTPEFAAGYIDTQLTTLLTQMAAGEEAEVVREQARLALGVLVR